MIRIDSRGKNRLIYTSLLIVCIVGFWIFENYYTPDTYSAPEGSGSKTEIPAFFVPNSTTGAVVEHDHFSLSYNELYEQAEWVAYTLKKSHLTYDDRQRPYYIEDPGVKTKSADWRNYKGSGYDRGHLCPAGDRRFSEYAYKETFYTSNITPQDKDFNAGVWNRLEMQIRYWCKQYGTLYIVAGGVLEKGLPSIGEEDVAVPGWYYKIVARGYGNDVKVVAFLIPHYETQKRLKQFLVPVDQIEHLTGIDFFEKLSDTLEDTLEKSIETSGWKF